MASSLISLLQEALFIYKNVCLFHCIFSSVEILLDFYKFNLKRLQLFLYTRNSKPFLLDWFCQLARFQLLLFHLNSKLFCYFCFFFALLKLIISGLTIFFLGLTPNPLATLDFSKIEFKILLGTCVNSWIS